MSSTGPTISVSQHYQAYGPGHFSTWRKIYQQLVLALFILPFIRLKYQPIVLGRHHVPACGPLIVASNHISLLDPPLLCYATGRVIAFMAKQELFNSRLKAAFYRSVGCFAVDRDQPSLATLKTAFTVLRSPTEWALGLFPEGTRGESGVLQPFKKGVGILAHKTQVPILPVGIHRNTAGHTVVQIGPLMTRLSDPDQIQADVYQAIAHLIQPEGGDSP